MLIAYEYLRWHNRNMDHVLSQFGKTHHYTAEQLELDTREWPKCGHNISSIVPRPCGRKEMFPSTLATSMGTRLQHQVICIISFLWSTTTYLILVCGLVRGLPMWWSDQELQVANTWMLLTMVSSAQFLVHLYLIVVCLVSYTARREMLLWPDVVWVAWMNSWNVCRCS